MYVRQQVLKIVPAASVVSALTPVPNVRACLVHCIVYCGLSACSIAIASKGLLVVDYSVYTAADDDSIYWGNGEMQGTWSGG